MTDLEAIKDYAGTIQLGDNEDWSPDDFPFYCLVGVVKKNGQAILDNGLPVLNVAVMTVDDAPIVSFRGTARAAYKHLSKCGFSRDHLVYIGYELGRAEICASVDTPYVQS